MADASILITAKDEYSVAVQKMRNTTKLFSNDLQGMQNKLNVLNQQKYQMKLDLKTAKSELSQLEKQMTSSNDVTEEMSKKYLTAQERVDSMTSKMALLTQETKNAEKQIRSLSESQEEFASQEQGSGTSEEAASYAGTVSSESTLLSQLGTAGLYAQFGNALSSLGSQVITSYLGSDVGGAVNSILSGTVTGAIAGSVVPGIGTAAGAVIGAATGVVEAGSSLLETADENFASAVQTKYSNYTEELESNKTSGSEIAAGRETDLISFSTLLGGQENANQMLSDILTYAAKTPFGYDDLTSATKTLLTFGVDQDQILDYMTAIGDAGSAVGLSGSDIATLSTYLGRMMSTGKVTQEYMNPLQERGIDVYGMLAEDLDITVSQLMDQISKGNINGEYAVQALITKMEENFGGAMDQMSTTYSGLQSTLEDSQDMLTAAQGDAYNQERIDGEGGLKDQIAFYDEHMEELQEAYAAIGRSEAELENAQSQAQLDSMKAMLESTEYQEALAQEDGQKLGVLFGQAESQGLSNYYQGSMYQAYESSQKELIERIQGSTVDSYYYETGYYLGEQMGKGVIEGLGAKTDYLIESTPQRSYFSQKEASELESQVESELPSGLPHISVDGKSNAVGQARVPYDNYLTYLHEGERVLTAQQARQADAAVTQPVSINISSMTVRQESDIDAIAGQLYDKLLQASRGVR